MLKNYIKIAWRNIQKNKGVFGLNILGLAIGIAACIMILLFIHDESSYDSYSKNAAQLARVVFNAKVNGEQMKEAVVMAPVAKTLKNDLPEVTDATRLRRIYQAKITNENEVYRDSRFAFVDPNFLELFSLNTLKGKTQNPIGEPNTAVITQSEARRLFGKKNPIGERLKLNDEQDYLITAVIKDVPRNSHFHFDIFASMLGYDLAQNNSWVNSNFFTYILLKKGADIKKVEEKLPAICEKYMGPQMKEAVGMSFAEFTRDNEIGLYLQPLQDIHLHSDFTASTELEQGGNIQYLYIFGAIAIFMIVIACINFMNLSTATATKRAKEVGIRKVLGSKKDQLIFQFLAEAIISSLLALLIAIGLYALCLPVFNHLSGKEFIFGDILHGNFILLLIGLSILIALLSGIYPAVFLSSFNPLMALKSKFSTGGNTKNLRSGLVVFQFVISAGLILGTLVVNKQMKFIQDKDLGYNKDQLLVLNNSNLLGTDENAFKNEILDDPRVERVSQSSYLPTGESSTSMSGIFLGEQYQRRMYVYNVDDDYIPTMGMKVLKGRNFSDKYGSENTKVILNEEAVKALGFGKDPIGKLINRDTNEDKQTLEVIGVVKDFNFKSLHKRIDPLIMVHSNYGGLIIRAKTGKMAALISSVKTKWDAFKSGEPFSYNLLDDSYNQTYLADRKMGDILNIFALLTIFVACLGLFGLVTYAAEQRVKEIGIRKVLGSSVTQIVTLLSKDFIKLILLSFLIAFPLGYYFMHKWLQDFAYRIEISFWTYMTAALITLLIALITISFKSIQAAMANPVKSIKTE